MIKRFGLSEDLDKRSSLGIEADFKEYSKVHFLMYAPTFRGGSQGTNREIAAGQGFPDYRCLIESLEKRFGGTWYVFLRLHPQLAAKMKVLKVGQVSDRLIDVSQRPDMNIIL